MSTIAKGMLAGFITCTLFGFSFMFSRLALAVAAPSVMLSWRFFIAFALLNLLLLASRLGLPGCARFQLHLSHVPRRDWLLLLAMGMAEPVLYFIGESQGINLTNASFASVIIAMVPIAATLMAAVVLKERPTLGQWVCSLLSVLGVVIVSIIGADSGTVTLAGIAALLLAVFSGAAYSILSRFLSRYSPFERTYVMFALALVWFLCSSFIGGCGWNELVGAWKLPHFAQAVLYLGALSSVVAYYLFNYSTSVLTIARSTVFINWTTVVSILAGVFFLHEVFTWVQAAGSVLILIGVWGANYFAASGE